MDDNVESLTGEEYTTISVSKLLNKLTSNELQKILGFQEKNSGKKEWLRKRIKKLLAGGDKPLKLKRKIADVYNSRPNQNQPILIPVPTRLLLPTCYPNTCTQSDKNHQQSSVSGLYLNEPSHYQTTIIKHSEINWDELLMKLKEKSVPNYEKCQVLIKQVLENDKDLMVDCTIVSLVDPLTKTRMELPARGVDCSHMECFDAVQFLLMNRQKETWKCPSCKNRVRFEDIEIDGFLLNILQSPNLGKECKNIIIQKDGVWRQSKKSSISNHSNKNKARSTNTRANFNTRNNRSMNAHVNSNTNNSWNTNCVESTINTLNFYGLNDFVHNLTFGELKKIFNCNKDGPEVENFLRKQAADLISSFTLPNAAEEKMKQNSKNQALNCGTCKLSIHKIPTGTEFVYLCKECKPGQKLTIAVHNFHHQQSVSNGTTDIAVS